MAYNRIRSATSELFICAIPNGVLFEKISGIMMLWWALFFENDIKDIKGIQVKGNIFSDLAVCNLFYCT